MKTPVGRIQPYSQSTHVKLAKYSYELHTGDRVKGGLERKTLLLRQYETNLDQYLSFQNDHGLQYPSSIVPFHFQFSYFLLKIL